MPIRSNGKKVVMMTYNGKFTREQIQEIAQEKSNKYKKYGFMNEVEILYPHTNNNRLGWRRGPITKTGEVKLYNSDDFYEEGHKQYAQEPKHFKKFHFYLLNMPSDGGDDVNNDCLYNSIKSVLRDNMPWNAEQFKVFLGLKRNDKVDISLIKKIDDKLKTHKINVLGDHIYSSIKEKPSLLNINLILKDGHYEVDKSKIITVKGIAHTSKRTLIYDKDLNVYDSNGERKITKDEFKSYKTNPVSSTYVLVPYDKECDVFKEIEIKKTKKDKNYVPKIPSMKDIYEQFNRDAKILKNETKGIINMFKTGTHAKTALNLFQYFCKDIFPEHIKQDEATWINNTSKGGLMFAMNYEGPTYKYDYCSAYGSIMISDKFYIPIKRGIFKTITNEQFDEILSIGIYRCKIEGKTNLFRFNDKNYYTSTDIQVAKKLKLKITLVCDDKPNALVYGRNSCVSGKQMFDKFVTYMFNLKKLKVPRAKHILNILWGCLCQENIFNVPFKKDDTDETLIKKENIILGINCVNDNDMKVELVGINKMFDTNFARLKPFLLSKMRYLMYETMKPHIDCIVRCHTDSMFCTKKLNIETGNELGDIRYEGYCDNAKIINTMTVIGDFA